MLCRVLSTVPDYFQSEFEIKKIQFELDFFLFETVYGKKSDKTGGYFSGCMQTLIVFLFLCHP